MHMSRFKSFIANDSGATAIEYALIASFMGIALVAAMPILATAITGKFTSLAGHVTTGT
jgi:pilus assembly protein Flp/PilA